MSNAAIGILGGSFNPPHQGHRALVQHAMRRLSLGGVRVLVSPQNPLKQASIYTPLEQRLEETRALFRGLPTVRVEPEAEVGPVYAVDSVRRLLEAERSRRFVYILGADSFASLHRWHRWRDLVAMVPIAVVSRPGYRSDALLCEAARAFKRNRLADGQVRGLADCRAPAWAFLSGLSRPESSTEIRKAEKVSSSGSRAASA